MKLTKCQSTKNTIDYIYNNSHGKILELGCGSDPFFKESLKVDIEDYPHIDLRHDLNNPIPLKEKFDTIISTEVIEHLWNPTLFLKECHRLLNDDGILILSTPNVKYWKARLLLLLGNDRYFRNYGHLHYYSPESLKKLVEECEFKVIEVKPQGRMKILSLCGDFVIKLMK